eukprot:gene2057-2753_t
MAGYIGHGHLRGRIAELYFWEQAYSFTTVRGISEGFDFTQYNYLEEFGLVSYYPCNEGTGNAIYDLTGREAYGGLVNGPTWLEPPGPPTSYWTVRSDGLQGGLMLPFIQEIRGIGFWIFVFSSQTDRGTHIHDRLVLSLDSMPNGTISERSFGPLWETLYVNGEPQTLSWESVPKGVWTSVHLVARQSFNASTFLLGARSTAAEAGFLRALLFEVSLWSTDVLFCSLLNDVLEGSEHCAKPAKFTPRYHNFMRMIALYELQEGRGLTLKDVNHYQLDGALTINGTTWEEVVSTHDNIISLGVPSMSEIVRCSLLADDGVTSGRGTDWTEMYVDGGEVEIEWSSLPIGVWAHVHLVYAYAFWDDINLMSRVNSGDSQLTSSNLAGRLAEVYLWDYILPLYTIVTISQGRLPSIPDIGAISFWIWLDAVQPPSIDQDIGNYIVDSRPGTSNGVFASSVEDYSLWRRLLLDTEEAVMSWWSLPRDRWCHVYLEPVAVFTDDLTLMCKSTDGVGADKAHPFGCSAGRLSHVALWSRGLIDAEVAEVWRSNIHYDSRHSALLAHYRLEEGGGTSVAEAGGLHAAGTLLNGASWLRDTPFYARLWFIGTLVSLALLAAALRLSWQWYNAFTRGQLVNTFFSSQAAAPRSAPSALVATAGTAGLHPYDRMPSASPVPSPVRKPPGLEALMIESASPTPQLSRAGTPLGIIAKPKSFVDMTVNQHHLSWGGFSVADTIKARDMQLQQVLQIQQPDPQATAAEAPMPSWLATEEYLPNPSPMLNLPPWKDAALRDKAPTPSPAFEEAQELNQMELEDPSPHQPTRETPLPTLRSSMDRQSTEHWTRMSCSNEELDTQMSIPGKNQARAVSRASNSPSGDEEIAGPVRPCTCNEAR